MTRILSLFQIKTVRSAWVFLAGSGLLFAFGVYQAVTAPKDLEIPTAFLMFWFLVSLTYMVIASWALISKKGRSYLKAQEQIPIKGNRGVLWFIKFLFACYAASLATIMLLSILTLPFAGYSVQQAMFGPFIGLYLFITGLVWAPLIFRYLK
jgi:hypothetical protein